MTISSDVSGNAIGYSFTRKFGSLFLSVAIQNKLIREYCTNKGLHLSLPVVESHWNDCYHQLFGLCNKVETGSHIILYSAAMMPDNKKYIELKKLIADKDIKFHFIQENINGKLGNKDIELAMLDYRLREYVGKSKILRTK
jgi:sporadic carbohydrate cluster protein (TIGR04323 family)